MGSDGRWSAVKSHLTWTSKPHSFPVWGFSFTRLAPFSCYAQRHGASRTSQPNAHDLIVTLPGTHYSVTYCKPETEPRLIAKSFPRENEKGASVSQTEFMAAAWRLANEKARELGWIV